MQQKTDSRHAVCDTHGYARVAYNGQCTRGVQPDGQHTRGDDNNAHVACDNLASDPRRSVAVASDAVVQPTLRCSWRASAAAQPSQGGIRGECGRVTIATAAAAGDGAGRAAANIAGQFVHALAAGADSGPPSSIPPGLAAAAALFVPTCCHG